LVPLGGSTFVVSQQTLLSIVKRSGRIAAVNVDRDTALLLGGDNAISLLLILVCPAADVEAERSFGALLRLFRHG